MDVAIRKAWMYCRESLNHAGLPEKKELEPELKKAWLEMMSGGLLSLWFAGSRK